MTFEEAIGDKALIQRAKALATPDGYAEVRLGMKLHPKQAAVLRDVFKPGSRVVFRCGNEVGKTRKVLAASILYAIEVLGAMCVSTAGVARQIKDQLIPALKAHAHLFPSSTWEFQEMGIKRYDMKSRTWLDFYTGFTARDDNYFQGFHADADRPLFVALDEAQGIEAGIFDSAEDRCNPTYFLATGSPSDPAGRFYEMETSRAKHYAHHKLTRMECLKSQGWWNEDEAVQRMIEKHGQDNPFIQSAVFGEFSSHVENALVSLAEFDRCLENAPVWAGRHRHMFCDFAAGRDKNVLARALGNKIEILRKWTERDTMSAVGNFLALFADNRRQFNFTAEEISGDADGLGLPMLQRLWELDWRIHEFHGGAAARFDDRYFNAISEAWGEMARRIKACEVLLPDDPDFKAQMLGRKIRHNSNGKLQLESKEDMKKRGLDSPDEADAVCCAAMPAPITKSFNLIPANPVKAFEDWSGQNQQEQESGGERRYFS